MSPIEAYADLFVSEASSSHAILERSVQGRTTSRSKRMPFVQCSPTLWVAQFESCAIQSNITSTPLLIELAGPFPGSPGRGRSGICSEGKILLKFYLEQLAECRSTSCTFLRLA